MKKILLTGASGFLGSNFCHFYQDEFEIYAAYNSHPITGKNIFPVRLDVTDVNSLTKVFQAIKPDAVIHLAAYCNINLCQLHPDLSEKINIEASENLATLCLERRIPFLFASTDQVFSGKDAPYKESALPDPVNIYGLHKSIAEQSVLDIYPQSTICRLPLLYGHSYFGNGGMLDMMFAKLSERERLTLFTDEFRTIASAKDICNGMLICLNHPGQIFHLGGGERVSRYELGIAFCEIFGFDKELVAKAKQKDVKMPAPRPKDVGLNNDKMKEQGWQPGNYRGELEQIKQVIEGLNQ